MGVVCTIERARARDGGKLARFLTWALALSLSLLTVEVVVYRTLQSPELGRSALIHALVNAAFATALWAALRGRVVLGACLFGYSLLAGGVLGAFFVGLATGSLLVLPLLGLAAMLPYLKGRRLAPFVAAALGAQALIATRAFVLPPDPMPAAERAVVGMGVVVTSSVLCVLLLLQFSSRLRRSLADTEKALRRDRELAEIIPQMVVVAGADGAIKYANARWSEYTGRNLQESIAGGIAASLHPDDRPLALERWRQALRERTPLQVEVRVRRDRDGAWRWHLWRAVPVPGQRGDGLRWFATLTDIDEHKQAETALRFLSEAGTVLSASLDYPQTLEALAQLAVPRLADWCIVHIVDERDGSAVPVTVAHADPARAASTLSLLSRHPLMPDLERGPFRRIRAGQPVLAREVSEAFLDEIAQGPAHLEVLRETRMSSFMAVPLVTRGRVFGILTLIATESGRHFEEHDLALAKELAERAAQATQNARLYREAQDAVAARDQFLSVASHELKSPLTSLLLSTQALQRATRLGPEGRALQPKLEGMERQVTRLDQLINVLLDVSRLSSGHELPLHAEVLELGAVAREVANRMEPNLEQAGCELRLRVGAPVYGRWDRLKLEQILTNLLGNAAKFGAGRPVEVRTTGEADRAVLEVRDHGRGIAPEDQDRIFGRFERAVSHRQFGGLGLGLWIARELAEAMGGAITVSSALGDGATFRVELPALVGAERERPVAVH